MRRVEALWRYPVKSMLGERVDTAAVGERGVVGDRGYALVDQDTGKVASAKNPALWSMLFSCRAEYVSEPVEARELPPVRVTLPGGDVVGSDDGRVHDVLSTACGRAVRLESTVPESPSIQQYSPDAGTTSDEPIALVAPGTFFDAAPLHVLTTASLAHLAALEPGSRFDVRRFRPNVVVAGDDEPGFVENEWVGRTARLGRDVQASVFLAVPRCVMTTLAQGDGDVPADTGVLQAIARHNRFEIPGLGPSSCVGVYALVTAGGTVCAGDAVALE